MIVCCIRYTLDPFQLPAFEDYARRWPPIIERCGGRLLGYFMPQESANNLGLALIEFENLAAYEKYHDRLLADPEAKGNLARARASQCILVEERFFLRRV